MNCFYLGSKAISTRINLFLESHQIVHDPFPLVVVDDVGDDDERDANGHHAQACAQNLGLVVILDELKESLVESKPSKAPSNSILRSKITTNLGTQST